jgi:hypothetical protein
MSTNNGGNFLPKQFPKLEKYQGSRNFVYLDFVIFALDCWKGWPSGAISMRKIGLSMPSCRQAGCKNDKVEVYSKMRENRAFIILNDGLQLPPKP